MKLSLKPGCRAYFFVQFGPLYSLIGSIWTDFIKNPKIINIKNQKKPKQIKSYPRKSKTNQKKPKQVKSYPRKSKKKKSQIISKNLGAHGAPNSTDGPMGPPN